MKLEPSASHLAQAQKLWGLRPCHFVRKVENFIYETRDDEGACILRLTSPDHRSVPQLEAELHWVSYLFENGLHVAAPKPSPNQSLVETLSTSEGPFFASVFPKAPGKRISHPRELTPQLCQHWGEMLGDLHRLTKDYTSPKQLPSRPHWTEADKSFANAILKSNNTPTHQTYLQLQKDLQALPTDNSVFGLVHSDFHYGNFLVERETITLFDFDDCQQHWFIYDFAVALFHHYFDFDQESTPTLLQELLTGYTRKNNLSETWIKRIPLFVQRRLLVMYYWCEWQIELAILNAKHLEGCRRYQQRCLDHMQSETFLSTFLH